MIQRIQTVYLFLIACLMLAMFFLPLAEVQKEGSLIVLNVLGQLTAMGQQASGSWMLAVIYGIIVQLAIFAIFSFKNRKKQLALCYTVFFLLLLSIFCVYIDLWAPNSKHGESIHLKFSLIFPLIALVLDVLAILGISKDNKLIKSLDRLR